MAMTKEQFQASIREMYQDAKDPNGELAGLKREFQEIYDDVKEHDAELATHLNQVNVAMLKLEEYVIQRCES